MTGRLHSSKQLKNKYNLLKGEWRAWSKLMDCRKGPTGIGFDQVTELFNASADWWAKMENVKLYILFFLSVITELISHFSVCIPCFPICTQRRMFMALMKGIFQRRQF